MTCEASLGVCRLCYGMDLSTGSAGRGGHGRRHHRRPVDRRAGHAADDADVPHRRHGQARRRGERDQGQARPASSSSTRINAVDQRQGRARRPDPQRRDHDHRRQGPRAREVHGAQRRRCCWSRTARRSQPGTVLCQVGPAHHADPRRGRRHASASRTSSRARRSARRRDAAPAPSAG